jgi:hypothetical protein
MPNPMQWRAPLVALALLIIAGAAPSAAQEGEPAADGWSAPDAFGYRYIDSRTPGGPEPLWYEDVETGVVLDMRQTGWREAVPIGFEFPFYGRMYSRLSIHTDGVVSFIRTDAFLGRINRELPSGAHPVNIAAFWEDLPIGAQGQVSYRLYGRAPERFMVIQWSGGRYRLSRDQQDSPAVQLILYEDGSIVTAYSLPVAAVDRGSATVGIQNETRSIGLVYEHDQPRVRDGLTIWFARPSSAPATPYVAPPAPATELTGCQDEGTSLGFRRILETERAIRTRIGCPLGGEQSLVSVEQFFDGAHMLLLPDRREIIVTFEDNRRWASFSDTYAGEPEPESQLTPPADRNLPTGAFGKLWRDNQALRERIRWPVSAPNAFEGSSQEFQRGMMAFTGQGQWLRAYLDDGTTVQQAN